MYLIPAVEWDEIIIVGDTSIGSPIITSVASTTEIVVGQVAYGANIPYNSRVLSKTVNSITLDEEATGNNTAISTSFYTRFDFEYPATQDDGEEKRAIQTISTSISGLRQVVTSYVKITREVTFNFITKIDRDTIRDEWITPWALLGNPFRWLDDQDVNANVTYELDSSDYNQKRTVKKHPDFLYELSFKFTRAA